jgi:arginine utilization regulatory protein
MDLFYRLGVVFVRIPPLRERQDGIESLTRHFIYKNNLALKRHIRGVSNAVMEFFKSYHWPGNVRELEHIIEGTMNTIGQADVIEPHHLPVHFIHPDFRELPRDNSVPEMAPLQEYHPAPEPVERPRPTGAKSSLPEAQKHQEQEMIRRALEASGGNVSRAARSLGISRQLLHYKMKKFDIERKRFVD